MPRRSSRGLTALLVALLMLALPNGGVARPTGAVGGCLPDAGWGTPRPELAQRVIALVNAHRAARGLSQLASSSTLTAAATWKARHMAEYRYMAHDDPAPPVARTTGQRVAACGYVGPGWGENIAYGFQTAEDVVRAWLASPGHRANIERAGYTAIGVGAASEGARVYWAQAFGVRSPAEHAVPTSSGRPAARPHVRPRTRLITSQLFDLQRRPRAGRRYTVRILVLAKSSGPRVTHGRVLCRARVAGRPAWNGVHRFKRGLATCVFRTPRWAHGGRLTGTIRVSSRGGLAVRWFSRRIR